MPRILTLSLFAFMLLSTGYAANDARPNFLIILADDLGYEGLGCYGGLSYETPELDVMAAEGLRFSRAYTSPVCSPTRVSLHTGLYTADHGQTDVLPVHVGTSKYVDFTAMPTFAQLFQADGYQTSTTGKWQLATLTEHPAHIANAGFDSWCVWQIWDGAAKTSRYYNPYYNQDGAVRNDIADEFGPDVMGQYVKGRMATANADGEPFMIVHNMVLPHSPIVTTPADKAVGRGGSLGNMINYMDMLVGELLDEVETLGIRENTYVFFIGDNGTDTGATRQTVDGNVSGGKRDLSDIGTHVPFIVWGPSTIPVGVENDLVDITDVFPTVCALAGVEIPSSIHYRGRSIAPQLEGREGMQREWVHQGIANGQSIFDGEWRLNKDGTLLHSRDLPIETEVTTPTPESDAAREKLERVFDYIDGNLQSNSGQVIDNDDTLAVTVTGEWKHSSSTSGYIGSDYIHDLNSGQGTKSVTFLFTAGLSSSYTVDMRWTSGTNRATNTLVEVISPSGSQSFTLNQQTNGGQWNALASVSLRGGEEMEVRIHNTGANGYVIVDALRIQSSGTRDFLEWLAINFNADALLDSAQADTLWGQAADPDADGFSNLLEYALGGNPQRSDQPNFTIDFNWSAATTTFHVLMRKSNGFLTVSPQYSTTLASDWTPLEPLFEVVASMPIDYYHDEVTYAYAGGLPAPSPLFIRLSAD
ncbi:sulfatase-like hydrolase/transferase [Cerasicoccus arenae]|uniref:Arylsulfatase n=1 Tax=Cerasicoccus arenae TaxID=424488 RepID=A0A8J3GDZ6_9BACT|nr:sulfatase-like hydrolase/transferase [Cerasicoccus arenae]MBK1857578.1 sulfatase-like hydrolase/transferase [Cerasicoccus arenae]GHC05801.1 hypothetical protein GCM10007047_23480 [Cerasicoccus arenae]